MGCRVGRRAGLSLMRQSKYDIFTPEELEEMRRADEEIEAQELTLAELMSADKRDAEALRAREDNRVKRRREYKAKNRERIAEQNRAYYLQNREAKLEYQRTYNAEHREEIAARKKAWYQKNRERADERHRLYRERKRQERLAAKCGTEVDGRKENASD